MSTVQNNDNKLIERVVTELEKLGIQKNFSGYKYLRKAVIMAYNDFGCVHRITSTLYPGVAGDYDTTAGRVERSIRHAIESSVVIAMKYPVRPTNGLIIAEVADRLRVEDGLI